MYYVLTFLLIDRRSYQRYSVPKSCPTLQSHGLQHPRLLCPSLPPRACSNSNALSRWCQPTISSSVTPFSSCPQSFPASGSFLMSQLLASGGQGISASASASASVFPMNIQSWFPLGLTGLILLSKGYQRYKRDYITNANNERLFRVTKIPTVFFIKMYVDRV